MRFRLRTLLIVLAVGPPVIALAWRTIHLESQPPAPGVVFPPPPLTAQGGLPYILPVIYFVVSITALLWWHSNRRHSS